jgi:thioredoxin-related protein
VEVVGVNKESSRPLEWALNLLSIAFLVYISYILVTHHLGLGFAHGQSASANAKIGQKVLLRDVNWEQNSRTLILVLSPSCRFCEESAPFYRNLLKNQVAGQWQAVIVVPEKIATTTAYVQTHGFIGVQALSANFESLGVLATPTLLLTDREGKLQQFWVGELGTNEEEAVAAALGVRLAH